MKRLLAIILLAAVLLVACDDNPGTYPCDSQIAGCANPTPALEPVPVR